MMLYCKKLHKQLWPFALTCNNAFIYACASASIYSSPPTSTVVAYLLFRKQFSLLRVEYKRDWREVDLFVRPVDEAYGALWAVVKMPRVDVGVDEVRNSDEHRHDPGDCDQRHCATGAQSATQRMHNHHISAFVQLRLTITVLSK